MSCFTVGSVGRHSNTHAYDGTDPVTPEMIGITGQRAKGTAVTLDGVIPDTALTEFVVHGKSTQAAVPSPDVSIPTGNNLFRGIGVPEDEEGYYYNTSDGVTATSDGFARFKFDNSQGTSNAFLNRFVAIPENTPFNAGEKYTLMVEFRNVVSAPTAVVPHSDNDFFDGSYTLTQFSVERVLIPVTARADISQASLLLRPYVLLYPGVSCDFEARVSIYPADYDVTEYEPYTGGPVEIESAEVGSAWACGKNLISRPYSKPTATLHGLTFTENEDGSITVNGTNTAGVMVGYSIKFGENSLLLPAGKYFSGGPEYVDNKIIMRLGKGKGGISGTGFVNNAYLTSFKEGSFTLSEATYVSVTIGVGAGLSLTNYTVYPRLTKFKEQLAEYDLPGATYPINLTLRGIPVDSGGNYTDADGQAWICDTYDAASGEYVRRVNTIESYASEDVNTPYMSTTGELTAGAFVQYALAEPVVTRLPPQYIRAFSPVTNAAAGGAEIAVEYNNVAGSAYKPPSPVAVTLAAADWTGDAAPYSQTVTAAGAAAKAGSAVETAESATDAQYTAALDAKLRRAAQSGADVTIKAYGTKPAIDIPILL